MNVSAIHLMCRFMTLCVADPIWGVCCYLYTLYNKSVFYYVNPYTLTLTLTLILILLLMIIFHLVLFPSKLCRAHINVFHR